ncbi:beta-class carbonic anhydrase [Demequina aurantiaca]|uniref:beta-class carbonic anhydrase n=1 Tax=Demequina aurantiaca TaxID=676200 RepID=UPI000785B47F|nr:carbonic anhydrase [Demequina aurantiaca]
MTVADQLVKNNRAYAESFTPDLPLPPKLKLAVVSCMDSRLDTFAMLGLDLGDAHIIRNAGGVVTDDVIRSLVISQRKLGTREIVLVHHTDCGALTFTDDELRNQLLDETGLKPTWSPESFRDLDADLRQSIERVRRNPFLVDATQVRGFVFDVHSGELREVTSPSA